MEIPRTQLTRLGSIRQEPTTVSGLDLYSGVYPSMREHQAPPDASQWMASILARQSQARETTPGTLSYTPTPPPAQPVATWNSWAGPCASGSPTNTDLNDYAGEAAVTVPAPAHANKFWFYLAAGLGAAASAAYLLDSMQGRGRR